MHTWSVSPRIVLFVVIVASAACGAVVRPEDGRSLPDAAVFDESAAADTPVPRDVVAELTDAPDTGRLRNQSRVIYSFQERGNQVVTARLVPDAPVPLSIDANDGLCRTYSVLDLPETRAGVLTVRIGASRHTIAPDTTRERFLYNGSFSTAASVGTRVAVDAEGSASFPSFSLSESIPRAIAITEPASRSETSWNSRIPITIRWQADDSGDSVQVILLGRVSPSESSFATVCTVPIIEREFVLNSAILQHYDALPQARRIDVYRIREARGVFGTAPVRLDVRNENEGANWISFR